MAQCFLHIGMTLDPNEKKLIQKLVTALTLLDAGNEDIKAISSAKKIDREFLKKARKIFDKTEACDVCSHAFHSWRHTVDDETVFSFIDDWINWKRNNPKPGSAARVVKMKRRT
jgi:hypothetical protein